MNTAYILLIAFFAIIALLSFGIVGLIIVSQQKKKKGIVSKISEIVHATPSPSSAPIYVPVVDPSNGQNIVDQLNTLQDKINEVDQKVDTKADETNTKIDSQVDDINAKIDEHLTQ